MQAQARIIICNADEIDINLYEYLSVDDCLYIIVLVGVVHRMGHEAIQLSIQPHV